MVTAACVSRRQVENRTRALFSRLMGTTHYRHLSNRLVEESATACFLAAVAEVSGLPAGNAGLATARAELAKGHQVVRCGVVFHAHALGAGRVHMSFSDAGARP